MKILWRGAVFNPTGIATAGREYVNALRKLGHEVQVADIWHSGYDFNEGKSEWNQAIDGKKIDATVFFDYPHKWEGGFGLLIGGSVHEGTRLWEGWSDNMNKADVCWAPSNSVRNLFKWNGVEKKIFVVPHGINPDKYKPAQTAYDPSLPFTFLSINSWTGDVGDRKGTELLIKAFDDEFKAEENVKLLLKFGTFWQAPFNVANRIKELLGHDNPNILVNDKYVSEDELIQYYQDSDCFVAPTRGEGFGLTIINSLACGCPVIVTKDNNSGHMDFCKGNPAVLYVDAPNMKQGDRRFYCEGNMLAEPDVLDLRKKMRFAFENRDMLRAKGADGSKVIRENWTWEKASQKFIDIINEVKNGNST